MLNIHNKKTLTPVSLSEAHSDGFTAGISAMYKKAVEVAEKKREDFSQQKDTPDKYYGEFLDIMKKHGFADYNSDKSIYEAETKTMSEDLKAFATEHGADTLYACVQRVQENDIDFTSGRQSLQGMVIYSGGGTVTKGTAMAISRPSNIDELQGDAAAVYQTRRQTALNSIYDVQNSIRNDEITEDNLNEVCDAFSKYFMDYSENNRQGRLMMRESQRVADLMNEQVQLIGNADALESPEDCQPE